ncbi:unnamed protein product [Ambrosiozyma monospora]|uniref:Unnamed protein product n=1 Tax=Ambrosiozyma monospora TaxID=43982 RepID=A0ACB5T0F5_AMBMO|nr:unnamed protein product [Ambrosiozyma monospora]
MNVEELFNSTSRRRDQEESDVHPNKKQHLEQQHQQPQTNSEDEDELKLALKVLNSDEFSGNTAALNDTETYDKRWINRTLRRLEPLLVRNTELRSTDDATQSKAQRRQNKKQLFDNESELLHEIKNLSEISIALSECEDYDSCYKALSTSDIFVQLIATIRDHPNPVLTKQIIQILNELSEDDDNDNENNNNRDEIIASKYDHLGKVFSKCDISTSIFKFISVLENDANLNDEAIATIELDDFKSESITLCLAFLVNLSSFQNTELVMHLLTNDDLNKWVVDQITNFRKITDISIRHQYAMEYLTVLFTAISNHPESTLNLDNILSHLENDIGMNIMEILLIIYNKIKKPLTAKLLRHNFELEEFVENSIQLLCLLVSNSKIANTSFIDNEGIDLMIMVVTQDSVSSWHIKKTFLVLSSLVLTEESSRKLIDAGILKPLFKHLGLPHKHKKELKAPNYISKYCLTLLLNLLKTLPFENDERLRLVNKFMAKNCSNLKKMALFREYIESYVVSLGQTHKEDSVNTESEELFLDQLEFAMDVQQTTSLVLAWLLAESSIPDGAVRKILTEEVKEPLIEGIHSDLVQICETVDDGALKEMVTDLNDILFPSSKEL